MLASESVTHKDFFQALPGKLIVEIGELDAFRRAERDRIKLAISTPSDRFRGAFERHAVDHPRQCVFVGTTNRDDYGSDDTGLRRFLPVRCGQIRCDLLAAARDQLFAEARARRRSGETWWETPVVSTTAIQHDRQADDIWTTDVRDWVVGRRNVTSAEVLTGALKFRPADMTRTEQVRIASILRLAGWAKRTVRRQGYPTKAWVNPSATDEGFVSVD